MKSYALLGPVVLPDRIVPDGAVIVEDGIITYAGRASGTTVPDDARRVEGLIAPGFVDIHCHAGGQLYCHLEPLPCSHYHLKHGTTAMCFTMYRNIPLPTIFEAIKTFDSLRDEMPNYLGVHLEGPYLNPAYGAGEGEEVPIRAEDYTALAETGVIRQWTCAPELLGTEDFIRYITSKGITAAIGHSEAGPADVNRAAEAGATLVTHLYDATGTAVKDTRFRGTLEVPFNSACLLRDEFYYEIICDRLGVHVRPENVLLAAKTAGVDRIVGITDCCGERAEDDDTDVNVVGEDLYGSKMTMEDAAQNFYALGFSVPEVFRICSLNPAKAIHMGDTIGSLEAGKRADILILTDELKLLEVLKA